MCAGSWSASRPRVCVLPPPTLRRPHPHRGMSRIAPGEGPAPTRPRNSCLPIPFSQQFGAFAGVTKPKSSLTIPSASPTCRNAQEYPPQAGSSRQARMVPILRKRLVREPGPHAAISIASKGYPTGRDTAATFPGARYVSLDSDPPISAPGKFQHRTAPQPSGSAHVTDEPEQCAHEDSSDTLLSSRLPSYTRQQVESLNKTNGKCARSAQDQMHSSLRPGRSSR